MGDITSPSLCLLQGPQLAIQLANRLIIQAMKALEDAFQHGLGTQSVCICCYNARGLAHVGRHRETPAEKWLR